MLVVTTVHFARFRATMVCLCECSGSRGIHLRGSDVMFLPKVGSLWFSAVSGQSVWLFHFFNNGALMFSLSRSLRSSFGTVYQRIALSDQSQHLRFLYQSLCFLEILSW